MQRQQVTQIMTSYGTWKHKNFRMTELKKNLNWDLNC